MTAAINGLEGSSKKGAFIVFEGIDGSGKSTQCHLFAERLKSQSELFYETAEPTDGPIGILIRDMISGNYKADERVIAALFAADRLEHLLGKGGIREKAESGVTVLTDRYYLSSYAYQSTAMPLEWVMEINSQSARILKPDCHIFIDISPETALERISCRKGSKELFETLERLSDVRKKYFEIFDILRDDENIIVVDGEAPIEKVAANIWKAVSSYIIG